MSVTPSWLASTPNIANVAGLNWNGPVAPEPSRLPTQASGEAFDSTWCSASRSWTLTPYSAAASRYQTVGRTGPEFGMAPERAAGGSVAPVRSPPWRLEPAGSELTSEYVSPGAAVISSMSGVGWWAPSPAPTESI